MNGVVWSQRCTAQRYKAQRYKAQRYGAILIWVPVLLLGPVLDIGGSPGEVTVQVALIVTIAATMVVAVMGRRPLSYLALGVLAAAVVAAATVPSSQGGDWLPTWLLLVITLPAVLRGWWLGAGLVAVTLGSMAAAAAVPSQTTAQVWSQGFVVALAGVATTAFVRLLETIEELRRTREELARRAVAEERERFSRDLHDLLGHTLSVMVVKAEAVRRLVGRDPEVAAAQAADIEQIGREALAEVREALDGVRVLSLEEELAGARTALDAAGIRAEVSRYDGPIPAPADQAFAWVVREGATNVLRHSGARVCRFDVRDGGGRLVLTVTDDGVGHSSAPAGQTAARAGGLDGLRLRMIAAGGRLEVTPGSDGFQLVASMPGVSA